jgi:hypothetical protein
MKKTALSLLIVISIILSTGCGPGGLNIFGKRMPDSSINHLQLRNPASTPDSVKNMLTNGSRVAVFTTADEMEYLVAHQDPDGPPGSFVGFEVSHLSSDLIDYPNKKTTVKHFTTENGMYLNMPLDDLLDIKGNEYVKSNNNGVTVYRYMGAPKDFLSRHNSEEYILEFEEVEGKVSRIRFGFIGPLIQSPQSIPLKSVQQRN